MANDYKSEDEVLGKAYDSKLMKRLLGYIKPYKKYVISAIILNIIVASLGPLRPVLTKIAIDKYIAHSDYHGLFFISMLLLGSLVLQAVIQYLLTYYTQFLGQKTIYDLRIQLFKHTQNLALKYFDKTPIGRIVTRVTNDIQALNDLFSSGIVMVFSDVFIIFWIIVFMFIMDVKLSWLLSRFCPCLFTALFSSEKK